MRTLVDIPPNELKKLAHLCRKEKISRAEAIRRAIVQFVRAQMPVQESNAFGLWKGRSVNALKYEDKLRDEWKRS